MPTYRRSRSCLRKKSECFCVIYRFSAYMFNDYRNNRDKKALLMVDVHFDLVKYFIKIWIFKKLVSRVKILHHLYSFTAFYWLEWYECLYVASCNLSWKILKKAVLRHSSYLFIEKCSLYTHILNLFARKQQLLWIYNTRNGLWVVHSLRHD